MVSRFQLLSALGNMISLTMTRRLTAFLPLLSAALVLTVANPGAGAELQPETLGAWETYIRLTEKRIATELEDRGRFLAMDFEGDGRGQALLRGGNTHVQRLRTRGEGGVEIEAEDGMIHHWLGAVFVPGVRLDTLIRWVQDYDRHQDYFQEVEKSRLIARRGDTFEIYLRLRRKKIITVVYNTYHTALYRPHDARRISSRSYTTKIAELDDPDTPQEQEKPVGNDRGFLWRLNSYWRFQEADGGVYVECESVSLSRSIPFGLGWLIRGYVESVPRESLQNTLTSLRDGVRKQQLAGK
jgi:hypothetical protein